MNRKVHGVMSVALVGVALAMALAVMFSHSRIWAAIYLAVVAAGAPLVLYCYCAKCPCRNDSCAHIIPGLLTRLVPPRKEGPYTALDMLGTALPLILIFALPQLWLWDNRPLFIAFWVLAIIAALDVSLFVCRGCGNQYCPLRR